MSINDLFEDGILNLPLERGKDQFRPFINKLFADFITKVDSLQLSTFFPDKDKDKIKVLVTGIQQCIDMYFDGRPMEAYQRLVKSFNDSGVAIEILLKDNDLGKRSL